MSNDEKHYEESDNNNGITLVTMCSDFDPKDNDPNTLRARLSCGHITGPQTLTDCCKKQLDEGKDELSCPVCDKQWSYTEVRKFAKLTSDEQLFFEETLANNATRNADIKNCPGCNCLIERSDTSNLCVLCTFCSANKRQAFVFCWQCLNEWKGKQPRSDRCDNAECSKDLDPLKEEDAENK